MSGLFRLVTAGSRVLASRCAPALSRARLPLLRPLMPMQPLPRLQLLLPALTAPHAAPARSIITVEVYQPYDRGGGRDGRDGREDAVMADVVRAEEIAMAQFNRLVADEVGRRTLKAGRRGLKRFSRFRTPTLRRRDAARATEWRAHKRKIELYMNWIQYRRRRSLA